MEKLDTMMLADDLALSQDKILNGEQDFGAEAVYKVIDNLGVLNNPIKDYFDMTEEQYYEAVKTLGLGLEDRLTTKVGLLSGGQRQALTLLMATLHKPQLLLLDEHTAALDPATSTKVLTLTNEIVTRQHLTAMMVTHNMKDAIDIGNRLIMMYNGHIIYDVEGEAKKQLTVNDLLKKFEEAIGEEFVNDRMLLG